MKWQQQYEQRQKELYLQLQQQHKNLQSPTALDLQSSLTTSSSSSPKPTTMILSSPDSTYDNIGSGKEANDIVAVTQSTTLSSSSNNNNNNTLKKKTPPKKKSRKNNMKPKDTRRHTSISFDEMCRLMRVYGSLKCLRNRTTTKTTAKNNNNVEECSSIKIDSTKRKFYRWFPDLDERFVRNLETGCYEPKAGHVNEMAYRESMRMSDQNKLVMQRLNGRSSSNKVHES